MPCDRQPFQAPRPFAEEGGCACAAVVLNSVNEKGSNFFAVCQNFARTKEAETHGWVMKCSIFQEVIDPQKMLSECV